MSDLHDDLFTRWFEKNDSSGDWVTVMTEKSDGRAEIFDTLVSVAADHVVGSKVIESLGGFPKAAHVLKHRIPAQTIARSGFLGEILATEYLVRETEFTVPVRRLRYRDTREQAMRGDDVLGFRRARTRTKVIKVEAKSRAKLDTRTMNEARDGLACHKGRPNPETLAFLECNLREHGRDAEAEPITDLQKQSIKASDVSHLVFTLSGNNPTNFLHDNRKPIRKGIELRLCGCRVKGHANFVKSVFDTCLKWGEADGVG